MFAGLAVCSTFCSAPGITRSHEPEAAKPIRVLLAFGNEHDAIAGSRDRFGQSIGNLPCALHFPNRPALTVRPSLPEVFGLEPANLKEHNTLLVTVIVGGDDPRDAVRHSHIYWPVLIALATGARRGEVLAIRCRNVDLHRGTIRIVESLEQTKSGLRFKSPKTDRARAVTLPNFAVEELCRLKREQAESLLMLGVRHTADTLVCARRDGGPLQPQSLTHEFPRFLARLEDFPRVWFHDLRHSHATQLLLARVHPKVAQERLGHSTVTTTLDLYSHVTATMQEDAAGRLDAAFRGAMIA